MRGGGLPYPDSALDSRSFKPPGAPPGTACMTDVSMLDSVDTELLRGGDSDDRRFPTPTVIRFGPQSEYDHRLVIS